MIYYIKNMVCDRCIMAVQTVSASIGISPRSIVLGELEVENELSPEAQEKLKGALESLGFSLIDDKAAQLVESIKTTVIQLVHRDDAKLDRNLSDYLSGRLGKDYHTLSSMFSDVEGTTIEKFFIAHKIERVKELLVYDELSLSEISYKLHYSSVAYLSSQFKKITGLTPSHFKKVQGEKRTTLDAVKY